MTEFYITLPSNTNAPEHPNNVTSEYEITLNEPLLFKDMNYEIGLAEIIYSKSWHNIHKNISKITFSKTVNTATKEKHVKEVCLPGVEPSSNEEILKLLNGAAANSMIAKSKFKFDKFTGLFGINLAQNERVYLHPILASKLGFSNCDFRWNEKIVRNEQTHVAQNKPDLNAGLRTIYVYVDIIKPHTVGNSTLPLIRMITPNVSRYGETVQQNFNPIHYFPIARRTVQSICVKLADEFGERVPFEFGNVVVKLHVKKRRVMIS